MTETPTPSIYPDIDMIVLDPIIDDSIDIVQSVDNSLNINLIIEI